MIVVTSVVNILKTYLKKETLNLKKTIFFMDVLVLIGLEISDLCHKTQKN